MEEKRLNTTQKPPKTTFLSKKILKKECGIENIRNIATFEKWNSDAKDMKQTK